MAVDGLDVVTCLGMLCVARAHTKAIARVDDRDGMRRMRLNALLVRTLGVLAWPSIMFHVICPLDHSNKSLLTPLLVSALIWYVDVHLMSQCRASDAGQLGGLRMDASTLSGLGFALSGLAGSSPSSKYSYLFLYAIILCFLVVLPSHNLPRETTEAQLLENVQRSVLMWCVSCIVTAVVLTRAEVTKC